MQAVTTPSQERHHGQLHPGRRRLVRRRGRLVLVQLALPAEIATRHAESAPSAGPEDGVQAHQLYDA
jgi:hypothetical protein